ncbi:hypothetical protein K504DRAFT_455957 [Pleomassaria siparia CBS 279.74]|uniref:Integral membrane protein n=1 Tax=Pleomassaria siparia CBS 279.74 TaxID=1314801 RepID=A0A6G1K8V6_9PLEO|nr:hypothetical protein K504DRAFT_455957 [Pleomassaria siparia CBS 279.74]
MSREFRNDPSFVAWGPLIPAHYQNEPITLVDVTVASVVWGLTCMAIILALYLGYGQTKASRSPLRSTYVWLIWLELLVSFLMGLECYLHLLKIISPSFAFYFTILFWWCIQVQLLLQIIINRIRVIVPDRHRSRQIMIGTAALVTAVNISVFNIWIPARLQISPRYERINTVWDRTEKVIYLFIDASLNWYFLRTVKSNLINNGLEKYNKLLRFNQRIIVFSLLMDVMIIAAMSIPNSFVADVLPERYIQFHPLAYTVKLNIEMTMANLIKRIAVSTSRRTGNNSLIQEFASPSNKSSTDRSTDGTHARHKPYIELPVRMFSNKQKSAAGGQNSAVVAPNEGHVFSFTPTGTQIKKTEEIYVRSDPNPAFQRTNAGNAGLKRVDEREGPMITEREINRNKNSYEVTEGAESVKSIDARRREDSDDEAVLVRPTDRYGWGRIER